MKKKLLLSLFVASSTLFISCGSSKTKNKNSEIKSESVIETSAESSSEIESSDSNSSLESKSIVESSVESDSKKTSETNTTESKSTQKIETTETNTKESNTEFNTETTTTENITGPFVDDFVFIYYTDLEGNECSLTAHIGDSSDDYLPELDDYDESNDIFVTHHIFVGWVDMTDNEKFGKTFTIPAKSGDLYLEAKFEITKEFNPNTKVPVGCIHKYEEIIDYIENYFDNSILDDYKYVRIAPQGGDAYFLFNSGNSSFSGYVPQQLEYTYDMLSLDLALDFSRNDIRSMSYCASEGLKFEIVNTSIYGTYYFNSNGTIYHTTIREKGNNVTTVYYFSK